MLLPEFLTFDDTSDMWKISVNFISCCRRWWRRHEIRQQIVSNVAISVITSQILQICEFAEPDQNPDQTVPVWFGFFTLTDSVRFEFCIFFCISVLVRFGSAIMWVRVQFVRFEFGSISISTGRHLAQVVKKTVDAWLIIALENSLPFCFVLSLKHYSNDDDGDDNDDDDDCHV